jgi:hypothetical protein
MITPIRRPAHRDLLDWEKEFNKAVYRIRYVVERTIANLKTLENHPYRLQAPLGNLCPDDLSRRRTAFLAERL